MTLKNEPVSYIEQNCWLDMDNPNIYTKNSGSLHINTNKSQSKYECKLIVFQQGNLDLSFKADGFLTLQIGSKSSGTITPFIYNPDDLSIDDEGYQNATLPLQPGEYDIVATYFNSSDVGTFDVNYIFTPSSQSLPWLASSNIYSFSAEAYRLIVNGSEEEGKIKIDPLNVEAVREIASTLVEIDKGPLSGTFFGDPRHCWGTNEANNHNQLILGQDIQVCFNRGERITFQDAQGKPIHDSYYALLITGYIGGNISEIRARNVDDQALVRFYRLAKDQEDELFLTCPSKPENALDGEKQPYITGNAIITRDTCLEKLNPFETYKVEFIIQDFSDDMTANLAFDFEEYPEMPE